MVGTLIILGGLLLMFAVCMTALAIVASGDDPNEI